MTLACRITLFYYVVPRLLFTHHARTRRRSVPRRSVSWRARVIERASRKTYLRIVRACVSEGDGRGHYRTCKAAYRCAHTAIISSGTHT